jgi:hypothetical protein
VYLDGILVCACLVLAGQARGAEIVTVEGLAGQRLHPVQAAFVEAGAVQCGFCTPGLVVATHDLLRREPAPSDARIREALAGNLCRCTGYEKILDAVHLAATRLGGNPGPAPDPPGSGRAPGHPSPTPGPPGSGRAPGRPDPASGPGSASGHPDPAGAEGWL